jgi:hypothetical protein
MLPCVVSITMCMLVVLQILDNFKLFRSGCSSIFNMKCYMETISKNSQATS